MWALANETPFKADRAWARDPDGAEVWIVAVKGTYVIAPNGTLDLGKEQADVVRVPQYFGAVCESSLLYDMDLVRTKVTTDILLHGCAYAPGGNSATSVDVGMRVGPVSKVLRVIGERVWSRSLLGAKLGKAQPFVKMPITYERAYGGTDRVAESPEKHGFEARNPVGRGFAVSKDHLIGQPAPNVEDPNARLSAWGRQPPPVGFGPIPSHWPQRTQWAGTYDQKWERDRAPLLPDDFNDRFYQCSPSDQQSPQFLLGGEAVELYNLTSSGRLMFELPRVSLGFVTDFGKERTHHRCDLHTVILEPEVPRLILVWQTRLRCHDKVQRLKTTTITLRHVLRAGETAPPDEDRDDEVP